MAAAQNQGAWYDRLLNIDRRWIYVLMAVRQKHSGFHAGIMHSAYGHPHNGGRQN